MEIKPIHDWVLIKRDPIEKTYPGSMIYITESQEDFTGTGVVIATGPGTKKSPMLVKEGDRVQWDKYYKAGLSFGDEMVFIHCCDLQIKYED